MTQALRAMVVDDELIARRGVRMLLAQDPELVVVGEARNGKEAVQAIQRLRPEILFLDIQMPDMDGFDVLRALGGECPPVVIFLTAYDQHALRAFEVSALDYVLKPFDDERFAAAVARAKRQAHQLREGSMAARLARLLEQRGEGAERTPGTYQERIVVRSGPRISFVNVDEIHFIQASGNYLEVKTGGHVHLLRETMGELEARLDPAVFLRIHRSTIVNLQRIRHVESLFRGEYLVVMQDGTKLPSSRTYRQRLEKAIGVS